MKYSLSSDTWDKEELKAIQDVIDGGRYTMGPKVAQFEKEFAEKFDVPYAVMVNSGSTANLLMWSCLVNKDQLHGDVIVPAVSWSTTYFPLLQNRFTPNFVDVDIDTLNLDVEQLGNSNIIGGLNAVAGSMTALDLDAASLTMDINQIGNSNQFLGDITGSSITWFSEFDGDSNIFKIQVDPTNTYGADTGNYNIDVTGSSNTFDLNVGTSALADTLDLDWIINGDSNDLDFDINYETGTNYVDIDGDSNTVDFDGSGKAGGYFYLDQTGISRAFTIKQESTLVSDWLKIISSGNSGTVCIIQNDAGGSTSC